MTDSCPECGDEFASPTGVRDHAWDVHGVCHYCGDGFADREALYTHWLSAHEGNLSTEDRKRAESKVGERTVCPACRERFDDDADVTDHAWDAHGVCHHCGTAFDGEDALHAHWLAVHGDELSRENRRQARSTVGPLSFGQRLRYQGPAAAVSGISADRRTVVRSGAAAGILGVGGGLASGILSGGSNDRDGGSRSLGDHPAAADVRRQPMLGPVPGNGAGTIVAFEDPSCPSCARFERQVFPRLKSRLVDGKDVTFVFRGVPLIQAWGTTPTRTATAAMESAYARNPAAFWSLKAFYYREQDRLGGSSVRDETRRYLSKETDVDADAVLSDVDEGTYSTAVDADIAAARNAGVRQTPTFALFRDEAYVADVVGPQSTDVFADSLGV